MWGTGLRRQGPGDPTIPQPARRPNIRGSGVFGQLDKVGFPLSSSYRTEILRTRPLCRGLALLSKNWLRQAR
jgi:hypothetical protein